MGTLKFQDGAGEFRIEICGRFMGACVREAEERWHGALASASPTQVVVDITRMMHFDLAGRQLLRAMHQHGTTIAASTPRALVFLEEITAPSRRPAVPTPIRSSGPQAVDRPASKAAGVGE